MIKQLFMVALMICAGTAVAEETLENPCAKIIGNCTFTVTSTDGATVVFSSKTNGQSFVDFQSADRARTKPIDDLYDSQLIWDCPDLLEQIRANPPGPPNSTFIDLKTKTVSDWVPAVFAINCEKRVVAYENDTVHEGSLFVSPLANLYQVINLDSYIHTDQPYAVQRANSHFDNQDNLAITYMRESGEPGTLMYTKTSITIPINYNGFVHSDQIDHSRSDDTSQLGD